MWSIVDSLRSSLTSEGLYDIYRNYLSSNISDNLRDEFQKYSNRIGWAISILLTFIFMLMIIFSWPTDYLTYPNQPDVLYLLGTWRAATVTIFLIIIGLMLYMDPLKKYWDSVFFSTWMIIAFFLFYSVAKLGNLSEPWFYGAYGFPYLTAFFFPLTFKRRMLYTIGLILTPIGGYFISQPSHLNYPFLQSPIGMMIVFGSASVLVGHLVHTIFRYSFVQNKKFEQEKERSEKLLLQILPRKISERLKKGENVSQKFDEATVLFADLVNFTGLSRELPAEEIVGKLDGIFSKFDRLVNEYGLEKIKTNGDEYIVAAGVPEPMTNHAVRMARLAQEMQTSIAQFKQSDGTPFKIRIGMHSGPMIGGIIGEEKFVYDIWGETVNLGSKMETTSRPGAIHLTETTKSCIQDQLNTSEFEFKKQGTIQVKSKDITSYFLKANNTETP